MKKISKRMVRDLEIDKNIVYSVWCVYLFSNNYNYLWGVRSSEKGWVG